MSKNPFIQTLALFVTFCVLVGIVFFFTSNSARERSRESDIEQSYLSTSVVERFDRLIIKDPTGELRELYKKADVWMTEERNLDEKIINDVKEKLLQLPQGRVVSRNSENWGEYALTDAAPSMSLYNGDALLAELRFGKGTPGPGGIYMRRDNDEYIYQVVTSLQQYQYYGIDQWADKSLITKDVESLKSFTLRIGEERWSFEKEDVWFLVGEESKSEISDQESFDEYMKGFYMQEASGFASDDIVFIDADQAISMQYEDGSEYVVSVDIQEEGLAYAQVTDGVGLFALSSDLESILRPSFLELEETEESEEVVE